jgi:cation diffusion facilitator CzcD-associated flavoprotein CzcO
MDDHVKIAIAGSGFAGLGMAIRLRQEGLDDFVVLERAHEVGGTWRDNTYPGCACDVPSHLYSFSFALNPAWSRTFSRQPEIFAYLRRCADDFGVREHVRFGDELEEAAWDDERGRWDIRTSRGRLTADVLVSATGGLSEPKLPDIPGIERFEGTMFHSARWDHEHDLDGERVAVIGTGASAIQFVPRIQPRVGRLHLFQRTPPWILPRTDRPMTEREHRVFHHVPGAQRLVRHAIYWAREGFVVGFRNPRLMRLTRRLALRHLKRSVADPELRRKLTPDYAVGCKRILISNDYLPSLAAPNVEVVTEGIREVRERSIVAADGTEREVDTIIAGTGFHVTDLPIAERVRGRDGRTLDEVWQGSPQAYNGTTVAGFPNLFILVGPNTGLGHNSIVYMIESQLEYVAGALRHLERTGAAAIEPTPEAQDAFVEEVGRMGEGTVWTAGGCESWYLDRTGRNSTLWPTFTYPFRRRLTAFDPAAHALTPAKAPAADADRELVPA